MGHLEKKHSQMVTFLCNITAIRFYFGNYSNAFFVFSHQTYFSVYLPHLMKLCGLQVKGKPLQLTHKALYAFSNFKCMYTAAATRGIQVMHTLRWLGNPITRRKPDRTVLLVTKPKSKIQCQTNKISANNLKICQNFILRSLAQYNRARLILS